MSSGRIRFRYGGYSHRIAWLATKAERHGREAREAVWAACRKAAPAAPCVAWRLGCLGYARSPWIAGVTLREAMTSGLGASLALRALMAGGRALGRLEQDALGRRITHGDLSPANLI